MKFQQNEGKVDRIIRIILGLGFILFGITMVGGLFSIILLIAGVVLLITGLVGFCGIYQLVGINTCPIKKSEVKSEPETKLKPEIKNTND